MTPAPEDPVEAALLPGFCTGIENLRLLKAFAGLCGPRVLDIGCYRGGGSMVLALLGKRVEAITIGAAWPKRLRPVLAPFGAEVRDLAFEAWPPDAALDGIWASHVLEHSRNPGAFLDRCRDSLKPDGWLGVVVPPFKHQVVLGHVTPGWNLGILMYALAGAGFDPSRGHFLRHGYNLAGFVPRAARVPSRHEEAFEDASLWPLPFDRRQGFDGNIAACRWTPELEARMGAGLSLLSPFGADAALDAARRLSATWPR
ncbi:methyltransferase domain-containing protein [Falsiroseomonas sp. CW058]|uniref:class I SAM-dependent methyltransferase n=1 Tax=Falsiroseomonas sp. CW058 TaxID=3388664 RepID=UPI003D322123